MATVFLDGRFISQDEARVSAFDAGFQHGVGLFETMTAGVAPDGSAWILHLEEHLERLAASASDLGLVSSLRLADLAKAVRDTVDREASPFARVRLTITGGDLNLLSRLRPLASSTPPSTPPDNEPRHATHPTLLIVAQPATPYPREMFHNGVAVRVADFKANPLDPFAGHKSLNYWPRLRELRLAAQAGADEALVFQVTNHLAGGCVSNAFIVKDGVVSTPIARGEEDDVAAAPSPALDTADGSPREGIPIPSPVLPGVTREWALGWALANGLRVTRRMVTISQVLDADEIFLTNSSWGVLPVVRVEARPIGSGAVGPVAARLRDAWASLIESAHS